MMGHFHELVTASGKNEQDAAGNARRQYLYEQGHRHDIRDITTIRMVRRVPPKKQVEAAVDGYRSFFGFIPGNVTVMTTVDDLAAPTSEWLEEWEFEIHSHA